MLILHFILMYDRIYIDILVYLIPILIKKEEKNDVKKF